MILETKVDVVQPLYSFASDASYGPAIEKLARLAWVWWP